MGGVGLMACQGFLVGGSLCLCSGGWNWMSSLWSAMKCPVVSFGVSMGLTWLWADSVFMFRDVLLFC